MNDHQKLLERYNHHKKIVLYWESAFNKTEGRDPEKSDFNDAPEDVKHSYKRYLEIKKYYAARAAKAKKSPGKRTPKKKLTPQKIFSRFNSRISSSSSLECLTPTVTEDGSGSDTEGTGSPARINQKTAVRQRSAKKSPKTPFYRKFSSRLFDISELHSNKSLSSSSISLNESLPSASSSSSFSKNMKENKFEVSLNSSGEELQSQTSSEAFSRTNSAEFQDFNSEPFLTGANGEAGDFPLPNYSKDCNPNIMKLIDGNWKPKKGYLPFQSLDSVVNTQQVSSNSVSTVINPEPVIPVPLQFKNDTQKLRKVDQSWLDRCLQNDVQVDEKEPHSDNSFTFTINPDSEHVIIPVPNFDKITPTPSVVIPQTHGFKLIDTQATETEPTEQLESSGMDVEIPEASAGTSMVIPFVVEIPTEVAQSSRAAPAPNTRKRKAISPIKLKKTGDVYAFVEDGEDEEVVKKKKGKKSIEENADTSSRKRRKVSKDKSVTITSNQAPKSKKGAKGPVNKTIISHPVELDPSMRSLDIFDEAEKTEGKRIGRGSKRTKRVRLSKADYFSKKVDNGKVNENFVRIDLTKKVFVRGRKKMTGEKMKKIEWKINKSANAAEAKIKLSKCRSCGDIGHFAKFCMKGKSQDSMQANNEAEDLVDDSPFPTLEEAARMVWSQKASQALQTRTVIYNGQSESQPMEQTNVLDETIENTSTSIRPETSASLIHYSSLNKMPSVNAPCIETLNPVLEMESTPASLVAEIDMLKKGLDLFGYPSFRSGQQRAVSRILRGQSTLVILSTGSGKSLCYMLPAYLYAQKYPGCLTLCISPLVSLMEDQVQSMPPFLNGACLHTNMTEKQREKVLESVRSRKLSLLLVSPEAVCGGLFGLLRDVENFPPIAFACIDEVHCVSQWSHNFRPSYLKLCKILREKLNVKTILGLTATATNQTTISICDHINTEPSAVIRGEIIPNNLRLSVSRDLDREEALLQLLRGKRFEECASIIIYCTRRDQCERISTLIRTRLQDSGFKSEVTQSFAKQRISSNCEAYHAGMSAQRRKLVQNQFMSGKIRIVVATVAFGMGIDKSDIRAVLHYNMPKTFESYVQEIGRAGRDGLPAECHLFLDSVKGKDLCELKRHVYSNSVDRPTIRKLLNKIFKPCKCEMIDKMKGNTLKVKKECPGHEVSFSVQEIIKELDLPEENVETLLCYLELDPTRKWIEMLPKCYQTCTIQSYGGAKLFKTAAATCPPLAVAIAMQKEKKKFKDDDVYLQFNLVEVASTVGWNSAIVRKELKSLEWTGTQFNNEGKPIKFRKSGFLVEFTDLAYRMIAPGNLTDEESDELLNSLHGHNYDQERTQLYQLHRVHQALQSVSVSNVGLARTEFDKEKSDSLKKFVFEYFQQSTNGVPASWKPPAVGTEKEESIRRDVMNLIASCKDYDFTSRAIAKIFQGIPSPNYPSQDWYRNRTFWRKYLDVDFHYLCQIAAEELS